MWRECHDGSKTMDGASYRNWAERDLPLNNLQIAKSDSQLYDWLPMCPCMPVSVKTYSLYLIIQKAGKDRFIREVTYIQYGWNVSIGNQRNEKNGRKLEMSKCLHV